MGLLGCILQCEGAGCPPWALFFSGGTVGPWGPSIKGSVAALREGSCVQVGEPPPSSEVGLCASPPGSADFPSGVTVSGEL